MGARKLRCSKEQVGVVDGTGFGCICKASGQGLGNDGPSERFGEGCNGLRERGVVRAKTQVWTADNHAPGGRGESLCHVAAILRREGASRLLWPICVPAGGK